MPGPAARRGPAAPQQLECACASGGSLHSPGTIVLRPSESLGYSRGKERGTTPMAGQDIKRREVLRAIGIAVVASHFPGFTKWAYAGAHEHAGTEPAAPRPTAYTPLFFSSEEFARIERLTELIIPSDETPGAREAGAAEFVDFMVVHDTEQQQPMRAGLVWLGAESSHRFAHPFL